MLSKSYRGSCWSTPADSRPTSHTSLWRAVLSSSQSSRKQVLRPVLPREAKICPSSSHFRKISRGNYSLKWGPDHSGCKPGPLSPAIHESSFIFSSLHWVQAPSFADFLPWCQACLAVETGPGLWKAEILVHRCQWGCMCRRSAVP